MEGLDVVHVVRHGEVGIIVVLGELVQASTSLSCEASDVFFRKFRRFYDPKRPKMTIDHSPPSWGQHGSPLFPLVAPL